jgi:hypothetical protein
MKITKKDLVQLIQEEIDRTMLDEVGESEIKHVIDIAATVAPFLGTTSYLVAKYLQKTGKEKLGQMWEMIKSGDKEKIKQVANHIKNNII